MLFTRHKNPLPLLFSRQTPTESLFAVTSQNSNGYSVVHTSQKSTATVDITTHSHNVTVVVTSQNSSGYSVVHTSQKSNIACVYSHTKIHKNVSLIILCTESYDPREQGVYNGITNVCVRVWRRKGGRTNECPCQERTKQLSMISTKTYFLWHLCHQFRIVKLPFGNTS